MIEEQEVRCLFVLSEEGSLVITSQREGRKDTGTDRETEADSELDVLPPGVPLH